MTEIEFTREVLARARKHHLLAHWCRDSRCCEGTPGLPDLIVTSAIAVMFIELKLKYGDTSAEQDNWLWHLERVSRNAYDMPDGQRNVYIRIYTPEDLASGKIDDEFRAMDS